MKKLLLAALCALTLTAHAEVIPQEHKQVNFHLTYPQVVLTDKDIENSINQQIGVYVNDMLYKFHNGPYYKMSGNYEVTFEDNNYLSIFVSTYGNFKGGNGVVGYIHGFVFDKHTGQEIPRAYFLSDKTDWHEFTHTGMGKFHKWNWEELNYELTSIARERIKRLSNEYLLLGNGKIALVYNKYEIGPGYLGTIFLVLSEAEVEYLNRIYSR